MPAKNSAARQGLTEIEREKEKERDWLICFVCSLFSGEIGIAVDGKTGRREDGKKIYQRMGRVWIPWMEQHSFYYFFPFLFCG